MNTSALIWVAPKEAAARIKAASQLGIELVDRQRDGDQVRLRFALPDDLTFYPKETKGSGAATLQARVQPAVT